MDAKQHSAKVDIYRYPRELRSCVKVEVDVLGSPSLIVRRVSVEVKQHLNLNGIITDTWSVVI